MLYEVLKASPSSVTPLVDHLF